MLLLLLLYGFELYWLVDFDLIFNIVIFMQGYLQSKIDFQKYFRHVLYCYVCSVTLADIVLWWTILVVVHPAMNSRFTHGKSNFFCTLMFQS